MRTGETFGVQTVVIQENLRRSVPARSAVSSSKGAAHRRVPPPEVVTLRESISVGRILLLGL